LGIGDWGLGIGPNPQSPIPNPQSPIPALLLINLFYNVNLTYFKLTYYEYFFFYISIEIKVIYFLH
jgi:hypothetical protein